MRAPGPDPSPNPNPDPDPDSNPDQVASGYDPLVASRESEYAQLDCILRPRQGAYASGECGPDGGDNQLTSGASQLDNLDSFLQRKKFTTGALGLGLG